jgi:hypothetical protein
MDIASSQGEGAATRLVTMTFRPGDYVYPADLPRRLLCRVACAESGTTRTGAFQILTLEPVEKAEGEWPEGTFLVRLDENVLPAPARDLWRTGSPGSAAV